MGEHTTAEFITLNKEYIKDVDKFTIESESRQDNYRNIAITVISLIIIFFVIKSFSKNNKHKKIYRIILIVIIIIMVIGGIVWIYNASTAPIGISYKPMIYIYSEEEKEITVSLGYPENLTCTYPKYNNTYGWKVIAKTDGTLVDSVTGREYYGLYWEGINHNKKDLTEGFIVKKENITQFLEEKLSILGLNSKEAEEFIVYWLPKLQENEYTYIRFQTMEEIEKNMPIYISEEPDTLIRIMMEWKKIDKPIEIQEQTLTQKERKGFTVVEWGGTEIK